MVSRKLLPWALCLAVGIAAGCNSEEDPVQGDNSVAKDAKSVATDPILKQRSDERSQNRSAPTNPGDFRTR